MSENMLASIWIGVTIVYGVLVAVLTGNVSWESTFIIVGAVVVGLGWVAIGWRRYQLRKDYEDDGERERRVREP